MKLVRILPVFFLFLLLLPKEIHAVNSIQLFLNGKQLITEVAPRIINDNTVVPVRVIAEQLGAKVLWNESARKVKVQQGNTTINLQIDNPDVEVNGSKAKLEVPPTIVEGNTLLPLRFVSEHLGVKVSWDELTRSVFLFKSDKAVVPPPTESKTNVGESVPVIVGKPEDQVTKPNQAQVNLENKLSAISKIASVGDQIIIQSDSSVTSNLFFLDNPDRLVIDLPNSSFDSKINGAEPAQNGDVPSGHPSVQKIRYALFSSEPSTVRIVMDLKEKLDYNVIEDRKSVV